MSKECKEWFKVIEIADLLGFSKVSVYNKIKTLNSDILQGLQRRDKGIIYYHSKAVDIIKAAFNQDNDITVDIDQEEQQEQHEQHETVNYKDLYISRLENEIEYLRGQLDNHVKLLENEQVLRREVALLDEARSKEVDDKITTWREQHFKEESKESKEESKGIIYSIKRLFKGDKQPI